MVLIIIAYAIWCCIPANKLSSCQQWPNPSNSWQKVASPSNPNHNNPMKERFVGKHR